MTSLKFKAHVVARRYPKTRRKQVKPMTTEPKITFLGALDVSPGETVTLSIPPDADAATVQNAILKANAERAAATQRESEALAALFHLPDLSAKTGLS
jgi:hypothetical protein